MLILAYNVHGIPTFKTVNVNYSALTEPMLRMGDVLIVKEDVLHVMKIGVLRAKMGIRWIVRILVTLVVLRDIIWQDQNVIPAQLIMKLA